MILPIIYLLTLHFPIIFCCYIFMTSSFLAPLPPTHSHRHLTLNSQPLLITCQAQLELTSPEGPRPADYPVIQNYYCQARGGELVKVTVVRVGREVLRLTDRITLSSHPVQEEDDRTKCSSNSSQMEGSSSRELRSRRPFFSKSAKSLLQALEAWTQANDPESTRMIAALRQEYASEHEAADFLVCNSRARQCFLNFCDWFFGESPAMRVGKLATRWMKRCLTAREHARMQEDYIEQVLQPM